LRYRLRGFTLIEILVSLAILAIITTISAGLLREMWSMQKMATSHRSQIDIELTLKILINDINAALVERDGTKNVKTVEEDGKLSFKIQRPFIDPGSKALFFDTVSWTFSEEYITRQVGVDNEPLQLSVESREARLIMLTNEVAYLRLNLNGSFYDQVIDMR